MDYKVKIKIGNIEIGEAKDVSQKTPFITDIKVKSSTSMSALGIGSSASDALYFTMVNPYQVSFDGEKVELFISPQADTSLDDLGKIIDEVGTDTIESAIDNSDVTAIDEDAETGEELTPEEAAEAEEQESDDVEALHTFFEGEADVIADVTTEEEEEAEWRKLGSFYVFAQTNSSADNSIKFECYDAFSMLGADFSPTETTATIQELYDDLQEQIYDHFGIVVDDYEFDADVNEEIEWDIFCSYRDAIGYFAGLEGGYAVIGADDTLGISFFTYNDTILLDNVLIKYNETSAGDTVIEAFECNKSVNPYKEDLISFGSGQSIRFNNPLMTDIALEKIYDMYHGIRFSGAEVSMLWNENIQCGEFIRIMSSDEYASYLMLNNALADEEDPDEQLRLKNNLNSLGRVILVNNQTVDFTADAISKITSICRTEYAASNKILSPKDAAFRNLYAEMIAAKYINAVKVVTDGLEAEDAHVKELVARNIDADRLRAAIIDAGAITAEYVEAHYADISFANVNTAHVSEAWVKELMIQGQLISQSGTVFKLIGVHINGDLIDANTLKADRILLRNSTDGLYYELNTHGGTITPSGYTEEQLKNGILGTEIVAHSITADQITANNIVGTGGWINLAQGTFNYQSLETGGGISWDGQHLEINADVVTFGPTRRSIEDVDEAVQGAVQLTNDLEKIVDDNYDRVFGETTYRYTHDGVTEIVWHDGQLDSYYYKDSGGQNIPVDYASLDKDEDGELIEDKSLLSDINDLESDLGTKASKSDLDDYVTNGDFDAALSQKIDSADVYTRQELDNTMATKAALESLQTLVNLTDEQMKQMGSILTWEDGVLTIGASDFKTRMKLNSSQLAFVDTNGNVISYVAAGGLAIPSEDTNILKFGVYDGDVSAANFRQKWKQSLQFDSITETYDLVFEYIG